MNEPEIYLKNVTKKYLRQPALENISFQLKGSGVYGVLGENGSGKTTLLKLIAGLLRPSSGTVKVMHRPVSRLSSKDIAYLSDADSLYSFQSAQQLIHFWEKVAPDFSKDKAFSMIRELNLDVNMKIKNLSKGNRARLKLVIALSRQVPVLVMDEPLSGLDPLVREDILKLIVMNADVEQQLLILSTHEVSEVEAFLDHVIFMKDGKCILEENAEVLREQKGQSLVATMREVLA
ncbi:ABC transporter ATP-binding protein [Salipaludibacillus aurantiacus]|uniref:ABC-2 type transport system ATP-binding protein n=1 Tax=Salipaludibacillus aurantiacus TaxID=1601833 RepID=A0A1H9WDW7_9BACI|nr:ABC transporter ATP-binding protein [Salipaludibacillus aurantiacus]SES32108.1 ABC-2 type transport system ATP-binding protein [Salipaludibacillus aurantiacus]